MLKQKLRDAGVRIKDDFIHWDIGRAGGEYKLKLRNTADNVNRLNAFVEAIEGRLGRELTAQELWLGLPHGDTRPIRERIGQDGTNTIAKEGVITDKRDGLTRSTKQAVIGKSAAEHQRDLIREHNEFRTKETWLEQQERKLAELEDAEEAALDAAERAAKAEPRVEHASFGFLELMFNPAVEAGEVAAAARRVNIAANGTPSEYKAADQEHVERQKLAALNAKMLAEQQAQQLQDQIAALESATFVETPAEPQQQ